MSKSQLVHKLPQACLPIYDKDPLWKRILGYKNILISKSGDSYLLFVVEVSPKSETWHPVQESQDIKELIPEFRSCVSVRKIRDKVRKLYPNQPKMRLTPESYATWL